jgi:hypothetical protein
VKVKVQAVSQEGEITKAHLVDVRAYNGASVDPGEGLSDVGTPMTFTFTAPQKLPTDGSKPSFAVDVVSRAGVAKDKTSGEWEAGLGKDWSGTITCRRETFGIEERSAFADASNSVVEEFTIFVEDGVGTVLGYGEQKGTWEARQGVWDGTYKKYSSSSIRWSAGGSSKAYFAVDFYEGKYSIQAAPTTAISDKEHRVECGPKDCTESEHNRAVDPGCRIAGDSSDPNRVQGSTSDLISVSGTRQGKQLFTQSWNLARQGATK